MNKHRPRAWSNKRGEGDGIKFILAHVAYESDECLIWPFSRNPQHGRGVVGYDGKIEYAHRVMCRLAHGEPPPDKPQARHSCDNGHEGCINPKHLEWGDNSDNQQDRKRNGTHVAHCYGNKGHLTPSEIEEMIRLRPTTTLAQLAVRFGLTEGGVRYHLKKQFCFQ